VVLYIACHEGSVTRIGLGSKGEDNLVSSDGRTVEASRRSVTDDKSTCLPKNRSKGPQDKSWETWLSVVHVQMRHNWVWGNNLK